LSPARNESKVPPARENTNFSQGLPSPSKAYLEGGCHTLIFKGRHHALRSLHAERSEKSEKARARSSEPLESSEVAVRMTHQARDEEEEEEERWISTA
jgi:hypothetical protein